MAETDNDRPNESRPLVEWIVGAASAMLVMALMVFLAYEAIFGGDTPADFFVEVTDVQQLANGTIITVAVANRGDQPAAAVTLDAVAEGGDSAAIQKTITLDYLPGHAVQRAAFQFDKSIDGKGVRIEVGGYTEP